MEDLLRHVAALEAEYRERIAARLQVGQGGSPPADWFRWADQLQKLPGHMEGLEHWMQIEEQMIDPMVSQVVMMLDQGLTNEPMAEMWASWRERYLPALDSLLDAFRARAARQSQAMSDRVAGALNPHLPPERQGESLVRKTLWVSASTPGVTAVLLGMRHPEYVEDGMEILKWPPLSDVRKIFEAMREVRVD